ncbi:nuclear transport factor 2 family protein [Pseudonocardia nantongensis]|uniref:nuclear transport factor 2 family protein n=1 Tax=Pseudonocardia nantongensis TaxID=1181885 RepID=UPI00397CE725
MAELGPVRPDDAARIRQILARYAHVIDTRSWDRLGQVFTPDVRFGPVSGFAALAERIEAVTPYHPHHTTNTLLGMLPDGRVRAWSKYVIVRDDGTAGSGDYRDTLVRTADGWRIAWREISRGHRDAGDPGGASQRSWTFEGWREG